MEMFDRISNDIKEAMKAKDKVRLETLRNIKKVFLEAKTAPGANDTLTDEAAITPPSRTRVFWSIRIPILHPRRRALNAARTAPFEKITSNPSTFSLFRALSRRLR